MSKYALRQASPSKLTIAVGLALGAGTASAGSDIPVTTTADAGPGSLRQAIIDANNSAGSDSIDMSAISGSTITLSSDLDQIAEYEDLQISGANVTLDGNGQACFYSEANLYISDLTITNCAGTPFGKSASRYGGAIEVAGGNSLYLVDAVITGNTADVGGGVYVGGDAYILNTTISNNSATGNVGGISATESLTILESTITGNSAGESSGGFRCSSLYGCSFNMQNSSVTGNTAVEGAGGGFAYAKYGDQGVFIDASTISSNTAGIEAGGVSIVTKYEAPLNQINNSTVTANSAAIGGGIYTLDIYYNEYGVDLGDVTFDINGSTIAVNTSTASAGGGILSVNGSATYGYDTIFNIDNSIIQGNIAASSGVDIETAAPSVTLGNLEARSISLLNSYKGLTDGQRSTALERIALFAQRQTTRGTSEATFNLNYTVLGEAPVGPSVFNPDGATSGAIGSNAQLGPLGDNGGPTPTHLPGTGSIAFDFIPDGVNGCGTTFNVDQRGDPRPFGSGCDAGSVEGVPLPESVPVPTMTRWGTGILALGLALMGWLGFRRRSSTMEK